MKRSPIKFANPRTTLMYDHVNGNNSPPKPRLGGNSLRIGPSPNFRTCPVLPLSSNNSNPKSTKTVEDPPLEFQTSNQDTITLDPMKCNRLIKDAGGNINDQTKWEAMEVRYIDCSGQSPSFIYIPDDRDHDQSSAQDLERLGDQNSLHMQTVKVEKVVVSNLLDAPREVCGLPGTSRMSEYRPRNFGVTSRSENGRSNQSRPDASCYNPGKSSKSPGQRSGSQKLAAKQDSAKYEIGCKPDTSKKKIIAVSKNEIDEYRKVALEILMERKKAKENISITGPHEDFNSSEIADVETKNCKSKRGIVTQKCKSSSPKKYSYLSRSRSISSERKNFEMLSKAKEQIMKHRERMERAKQHSAKPTTLPPSFKSKHLDVKTKALSHTTNQDAAQKNVSQINVEDRLLETSSQKTSTECSPKKQRSVGCYDCDPINCGLNQGESYFNITKRRQATKDQHCLLRSLRRHNEIYPSENDNQLIQNILKSPTAKAVQALCLFYQKADKINSSKSHDIMNERDVSVNDILEAYQKLFLGTSHPTKSKSSVTEDTSRAASPYSPQYTLSKPNSRYPLILKTRQQTKRNKSSSPPKAMTYTEARPVALSWDNDPPRRKHSSVSGSDSLAMQILSQSSLPSSLSRCTSRASYNSLKVKTQEKGINKHCRDEGYHSVTRQKKPGKSYSNIHFNRIRKGCQPISDLYNTSDSAILYDKARRKAKSLIPNPFKFKTSPKIKRHIQPFGDKKFRYSVGNKNKTIPVHYELENTSYKKRSPTKYTVLENKKLLALHGERPEDASSKKYSPTVFNIIGTKKSAPKQPNASRKSKTAENLSCTKHPATVGKINETKHATTSKTRTVNITPTTKAARNVDKLSSKNIPLKYSIIENKLQTQLKAERQYKKSHRSSAIPPVSVGKIQMTRSDSGLSREDKCRKEYSARNLALGKGEVRVIASDCHQIPMQYWIRQKGTIKLMRKTFITKKKRAQFLEENGNEETCVVSKAHLQGTKAFLNLYGVSSSHDGNDPNPKQCLMSSPRSAQHQGVVNVFSQTKNINKEAVPSVEKVETMFHPDHHSPSLNSKKIDKVQDKTQSIKWAREIERNESGTRLHMIETNDTLELVMPRLDNNGYIVPSNEDEHRYSTKHNEFNEKPRASNVKSKSVDTMDSFGHYSKIYSYQMQNQMKIQEQNPSSSKPLSSVSESDSRQSSRNYWTRPNSGVREVKITLKDDKCNDYVRSGDERDIEGKKENVCSNAKSLKRVAGETSLTAPIEPDHSENSSRYVQDYSGTTPRHSHNRRRFSDPLSQTLINRVNDITLKVEPSDNNKISEVDVTNYEMEVPNTKNETEMSGLENDSTYISSKLFSTHPTSKLTSYKEDSHQYTKENADEPPVLEEVSVNVANVEVDAKSNQIKFQGQERFLCKSRFLQSKSDSYQISGDNEENTMLSKTGGLPWKNLEELARFTYVTGRRPRNLKRTQGNLTPRSLSESEHLWISQYDVDKTESCGVNAQTASGYSLPGKPLPHSTDTLKNVCSQYGKNYASIYNKTVLAKAQYSALKNKNAQVANIKNSNDVDKILELTEDEYKSLEVGEIPDFYRLVGFSISDDGSSDTKSKTHTSRTEAQSITQTRNADTKEPVDSSVKHTHEPLTHSSSDNGSKTCTSTEEALSAMQLRYENKKKNICSKVQHNYNVPINSKPNSCDLEKLIHGAQKSSEEGTTTSKSFGTTKPTESESSDERDRSETISSANFRERTVRNVVNYFSNIRPNQTIRDNTLHFMQRCALLNKGNMMSNVLPENGGVVLDEEPHMTAAKNQVDSTKINTEIPSLYSSQEHTITENDSSISCSNSTSPNNEKENNNSRTFGDALNIIKESYSHMPVKCNSPKTKLTNTTKDSKESIPLEQCYVDETLKSIEGHFSNKEKSIPVPYIIDELGIQNVHPPFHTNVKNQNDVTDVVRDNEQMSGTAVHAEQNVLHLAMNECQQPSWRGYWDNCSGAPYKVYLTMNSGHVSQTSATPGIFAREIRTDHRESQYPKSTIHQSQDSEYSIKKKFKTQHDIPYVTIPYFMYSSRQGDDFSQADNSEFSHGCNEKCGLKESDIIIEHHDYKIFGANSTSQISVRTGNEIDEKDLPQFESCDGLGDPKCATEDCNVDMKSEIEVNPKHGTDPDNRGSQKYIPYQCCAFPRSEGVYEDRVIVDLDKLENIQRLGKSGSNLENHTELKNGEETLPNVKDSCDVILNNYPWEKETNKGPIHGHYYHDLEVEASFVNSPDAEIIGNQCLSKNDNGDAYGKKNEVNDQYCKCSDCTSHSLHYEYDTVHSLADSDRKDAYSDVCDYIDLCGADSLKFIAMDIIPPPVEFRSSGIETCSNTDVEKWDPNETDLKLVQKISPLSEESIRDTPCFTFKDKNDIIEEGVLVKVATDCKAGGNSITEFYKQVENNGTLDENHKNVRINDCLDESNVENVHQTSRDIILKIEKCETVSKDLVNHENVAKENCETTNSTKDIVENSLFTTDVEMGEKDSLAFESSQPLNTTNVDNIGHCREKTVHVTENHETVEMPLGHDVHNKQLRMVEDTTGSVESAREESGERFGTEMKRSPDEEITGYVGFLERVHTMEEKRIEWHHSGCGTETSDQKAPTTNIIPEVEKCSTVRKLVANIEKGETIDNIHPNFEKVDTPEKTVGNDERGTVLGTITANVEKGDVVKTIVAYIENSSKATIDEIDETFENADPNTGGNVDMIIKVKDVGSFAKHENIVDECNIIITPAENNGPTVTDRTNCEKGVTTENTNADIEKVNYVGEYVEETNDEENVGNILEEHVTFVRHVATVDASVQVGGCVADSDNDVLTGSVNNGEIGAQGDQMTDAIGCCECGIQIVKECGDGELMNEHRPFRYQENATPTHKCAMIEQDSKNVTIGSHVSLDKTRDKDKNVRNPNKTNETSMTNGENNNTLETAQDGETDYLHKSTFAQGNQPAEINNIHRHNSCSSASVNNDVVISFEKNSKQRSAVSKISSSSKPRSGDKSISNTPRIRKNRMKSPDRRFSSTPPITLHYKLNGVRTRRESGKCAPEIARIQELKKLSNDESFHTTSHQFDTDETYNFVEIPKLPRDSLAITSHQFDTDRTSKSSPNANMVEMIEFDTDCEIDTEAVIDSLSFLEDERRGMKGYYKKCVAYERCKQYSYTKSNEELSFAQVPNYTFPDDSTSNLKRSPIQYDFETEEHRNASTSIADDTVRVFLDVFSKRFMASLEQAVANLNHRLKAMDNDENGTQGKNDIAQHSKCNCCHNDNPVNATGPQKMKSGDILNKLTLNKISPNDVLEGQGNICEVKDNVMHRGMEFYNTGQYPFMPDNGKRSNPLIPGNSVENEHQRATTSKGFEQEALRLTNYKNVPNSLEINGEGKRSLFEHSESSNNDQEKHSVLFEHILNTMAFDIQAYFDHLKDVAVNCQSPKKFRGCSREWLFFRHESPPAQRKNRHGNIQTLPSHQSWSENCYLRPEMSGYYRHVNSLNRSNELIKFNPSPPSENCFSEPYIKEGTLSARSSDKTNPYQIPVARVQYKRKSVLIPPVRQLIINNDVDDIGRRRRHLGNFCSLPGILVPTSNICWGDIIWNDCNVPYGKPPRKRSPDTIKDYIISNKNCCIKKLNISRSEYELDTFNELGSFTTEMQSSTTLSYNENLTSDGCIARYDSSTEVESESSLSSMDYKLNHKRRRRSKFKHNFSPLSRRGSLSPNRRRKLREYGSTSTSRTGFKEHRREKRISCRSFPRHKRHVTSRGIVSVCKHEIDQAGIQQKVQSIISMSLLKFMTDMLHLTRNNRGVSGSDTTSDKPEPTRGITSKTPEQYYQREGILSSFTKKNAHKGQESPKSKAISDKNVKHVQRYDLSSKSSVLPKQSISMGHVERLKNSMSENHLVAKDQSMPPAALRYDLITGKQKTVNQRNDFSINDILKEDSVCSRKDISEDHLSWLVHPPVPDSRYTSLFTSYSEEMEENNYDMSQGANRLNRGNDLPESPKYLATRCKKYDSNERDRLWSLKTADYTQTSCDDSMLNANRILQKSYLGSLKKCKAITFGSCFEKECDRGMYSNSKKSKNSGANDSPSFSSTKVDFKNLLSLPRQEDESISQNIDDDHYYVEFGESIKRSPDVECQPYIVTHRNKYARNRCKKLYAVHRSDLKMHRRNLKGGVKSTSIYKSHFAGKLFDGNKNMFSNFQNKSPKMLTYLSSPKYLPKRFSPHCQYSKRTSVSTGKTPEKEDRPFHQLDDFKRTNNVDMNFERRASGCCIGAREEVFDSYINRLSEIRSDMHAKFENVFQCKKASKSQSFKTQTPKFDKDAESMLNKASKKIDDKNKIPVDNCKRSTGKKYLPASNKSIGMKEPLLDKFKSSEPQNSTLTSFLDNIHSEDGWNKCWSFGTFGSVHRKTTRNNVHEQHVARLKDTPCSNVQATIRPSVSEDSILRSKSKDEDQSQSNIGDKSSDDSHVSLIGKSKYNARRGIKKSEVVIDPFKNCEYNICIEDKRAVDKNCKTIFATKQDGRLKRLYKENAKKIKEFCKNEVDENQNDQCKDVFLFDATQSPINPSHFYNGPIVSRKTCLESQQDLVKEGRGTSCTRRRKNRKCRMPGKTEVGILEGENSSFLGSHDVLGEDAKFFNLNDDVNKEKNEEERPGNVVSTPSFTDRNESFKGSECIEREMPVLCTYLRNAPQPINGSCKTRLKCCPKEERELAENDCNAVHLSCERRSLELTKTSPQSPNQDQNATEGRKEMKLDIYSNDIPVKRKSDGENQKRFSSLRKKKFFSSFSKSLSPIKSESLLGKPNDSVKDGNDTSNHKKIDENVYYCRNINKLSLDIKERVAQLYGDKPSFHEHPMINHIDVKAHSETTGSPHENNMSAGKVCNSADKSITSNQIRKSCDELIKESEDAVGVVNLYGEVNIFSDKTPKNVRENAVFQNGSDTIVPSTSFLGIDDCNVKSVHPLNMGSNESKTRCHEDRINSKTPKVVTNEPSEQHPTNKQDIERSPIETDNKLPMPLSMDKQKSSTSLNGPDHSYENNKDKKMTFDLVNKPQHQSFGDEHKVVLANVTKEPWWESTENDRKAVKQSDIITNDINREVCGGEMKTDRVEYLQKHFATLSKEAECNHSMKTGTKQVCHTFKYEPMSCFRSYSSGRQLNSQGAALEEITASNIHGIKDNSNEQHQSQEAASDQRGKPITNKAVDRYSSKGTKYNAMSYKNTPSTLDNYIDADFEIPDTVQNVTSCNDLIEHNGDTRIHDEIHTNLVDKNTLAIESENKDEQMFGTFSLNVAPANNDEQSCFTNKTRRSIELLNLAAPQELVSRTVSKEYSSSFLAFGNEEGIGSENRKQQCSDGSHTNESQVSTPIPSVPPADKEQIYEKNKNKSHNELSRHLVRQETISNDVWKENSSYVTPNYSNERIYSDKRNQGHNELSRYFVPQETVSNAVSKENNNYGSSTYSKERIYAEKKKQCHNNNIISSQSYLPQETTSPAVSKVAIASVSSTNSNERICVEKKGQRRVELFHSGEPPEKISTVVLKENNCVNPTHDIGRICVDEKEQGNTELFHRDGSQERMFKVDSKVNVFSASLMDINGQVGEEKDEQSRFKMASDVIQGENVHAVTAKEIEEQSTKKNSFGVSALKTNLSLPSVEASSFDSKTKILFPDGVEKYKEGANSSIPDVNIFSTILGKQKLVSKESHDILLQKSVSSLVAAQQKEENHETKHLQNTEEESSCLKKGNSTSDGKAFSVFSSSEKTGKCGQNMCSKISKENVPAILHEDEKSPSEKGNKVCGSKEKNSTHPQETNDYPAMLSQENEAIQNEKHQSLCQEENISTPISLSTEESNQISLTLKSGTVLSSEWNLAHFDDVCRQDSDPSNQQRRHTNQSEETMSNETSGIKTSLRHHSSADKSHKHSAVRDNCKAAKMSQNNDSMSQTASIASKCSTPSLKQKHDIVKSRDRSPLHRAKAHSALQFGGSSLPSLNHYGGEPSPSYNDETIDSIVDSKASRKSSKSYRMKRNSTNLSFPVEIKTGSPHQIVEDFKRSKVKPSQIPVDVYKLYPRGKRSFSPQVRTLTISGPLMNMNIPVFRHGAGEVPHPKSRCNVKTEAPKAICEQCENGKADAQDDHDFELRGATPTGQDNLSKPRWKGVMKKFVPFGKKKTG